MFHCTQLSNPNSGFVATTSDNRGKENSSYPHCSSYGSDEEPPGWLGLLLLIICVSVVLFSLILFILLLLFWRAERVSNLDVTLIQSNLLPFEVGFLIKHPPKGLKRRRKKEKEKKGQCKVTACCVWPLFLLIICLCTFHRHLLLQHHSDVSKQRVFLIINVEIVFVITLINASVDFTQLYGFVTNKKTFRGRDIKNLTLVIHYFTILLLINPRHKTLWESEAKWNPTTLLLFKIGFSFTALSLNRTHTFSFL